MLKTRYAEKEDLPQVYIMYLEALREIGEKYDEDRAFHFMMVCWAKAPCILLENDDSIVGFAGLNTYTPAYNKEVYLREYMFFIQPSHRGLKAWRVLCRAVQKTADQFQIKFVGEHRLQGSIKHHERLIRMAGAKPFAIMSVYGGKK